MVNKKIEQEGRDVEDKLANIISEAHNETSNKVFSNFNKQVDEFRREYRNDILHLTIRNMIDNTRIVGKDNCEEGIKALREVLYEVLDQRDILIVEHERVRYDLFELANGIYAFIQKLPQNTASTYAEQLLQSGEILRETAYVEQANRIISIAQDINAGSGSQSKTD